jgi:hypothetical protein
LVLIALGLCLVAAPGCRRRSAARRPAEAGVPPSATIEGRVVDRRAHPVPEARVLLFSLAGGGRPIETATDLEGHFRFERLPAAGHRILVEATGFPAAELATVTAPATAVELRLDGEGRAIVGSVTAAGAPVAGARVLLAAEAGGPIRETISRAAGGFAFGGLGEGTYALRAVRSDEAAPQASLELRGVRAEDSAPSASSRLRLELGAAQLLRGRVVDDAGAGLASVGVRAEDSAGGPGGDLLPALARSDGGGGFALGPLPPGSYRLTAARPGEILRRAPVVELRAAAPAPPPVVLELVRGARVAGRVRDGRGAPASGARLRCVAAGMEELTVQEGQLPLAAEAAAMPAGSGRALGASRAAVADREGRFSVDDLIPGRYHLEIAYPGSEPFRSDEVAIAPGERRDVGVLTLRAGLTVEGRVVDEGALPIEGARVSVAGTGATVALGGYAAVTDAEGRFTFALPAGGYRLSATASGHGPGQAAVELSGGGPAPAPVQIRLLRAEAKLEGLVQDDGGRPLGRARVQLFPAEAPAVGAAAPVGSGSTDVGGHFAIAGLPAGDLRVEIDHPDYPLHAEVVSAGRYARVTVPFPGGVVGEIRARATGAEVARAHVEAVGPAGAKAAADVRKRGSFRLTRLVPGHWRLTVAAPGFRTVEREVDVAAAVSLGEPSVRDLRVDLDPS